MKKILKIAFYCIIFIFITIIGIYISAYSLGKPILEQERFVKMYDQDGLVFYETNANYSGQYVSIDEVSDHFLDAIVAIEDHRFYNHIGFDFIGIGRAIATNITSSSKSQGASTISQQYARLLYLNNDKTWSRKIKEAYLTMQLESHLTKEQILEGYINQVYFGHGIYGIENASYYYFGKSSMDLDLNQATILAGVVNGPSYYSPILDMENSKSRQTLVLQRMVDLNYIDKSIMIETQNTQLILSTKNESLENTQYYYFRDTVYEELEALGLNTDYYLNKGLNIHTTLSSSIQDELIDSINTNTMNGQAQTANIIVEPYTSKILALMGGNDYTLSQYNRATNSLRHIGSTIKPFLYYEALENGFDATTKFISEPTTFQLSDGNTYSPSNYNDTYAYDDVTLAQAIAVSDNIYAMKTHMFLGENILANLLNELEFDHVNENASLALGTLNTNVFELANAYNTIASEGLYQEIYTIEYITDDDGNILYRRDVEPVQLLDKDSCLILSQLMTGSFDSQFNTYLSATMSGRMLDNINACKTGTTDYDSLAVGFNPNILVVSWTGIDDNSYLTDYSDKVCSKLILMDILKYNLENNEITWYKPTENIQEVKINPITGLEDNDGSVYWFKKK